MINPVNCITCRKAPKESGLRFCSPCQQLYNDSMANKRIVKSHDKKEVKKHNKQRKLARQKK